MTYLLYLVLAFQVISLSSSRNMAIIGVSVILGLMVPTYMKDNEHALNTGTHICHPEIWLSLACL